MAKSNGKLNIFTKKFLSFYYSIKTLIPLCLYLSIAFSIKMPNDETIANGISFIIMGIGIMSYLIICLLYLLGRNNKYLNTEFEDFSKGSGESIYPEGLYSMVETYLLPTYVILKISHSSENDAVLISIIGLFIVLRLISIYDRPVRNLSGLEDRKNKEGTMYYDLLLRVDFLLKKLLNCKGILDAIFLLLNFLLLFKMIRLSIKTFPYVASLMWGSILILLVVMFLSHNKRVDDNIPYKK